MRFGLLLALVGLAFSAPKPALARGGGTYLVKGTKTPAPAELDVTAQGIARAAKRLRGKIAPTPLVYSAELSKKYGVEIYLKLESATAVGSFKIRGAMNKVLSLPSGKRKNGIFAASTGNHAQGVAYAADKTGVEATIVMPEGASELKADKTRKLGGKVLMQGKDYGESVTIARKLAETSGGAFVSGYEDKHVIEGQGTIGHEIKRQLPDVDWVLSALGGGGLMGGISSAWQGKAKQPVFIGVQSENNAPMVKTLRLTPKQAGKGFKNEIQKTVADGTLVTHLPSDKMVDLLRSRLDLVVKVPEKRVGKAVLELLDEAGQRIEGAGALPLAGLDLALKDLGRTASLKGIARPKKVVLVLSGGNIDQHKIDELREQQ